jgi:hypothetical protein
MYMDYIFMNIIQVLKHPVNINIVCFQYRMDFTYINYGDYYSVF